MDIIYTWTVIEMQVLLDVNSMQNVVYFVKFIVTAEKDGITITSRE